MKLSKLDGMQWNDLVQFMKADYLSFALESTPHEISVAAVAYETGAEAGAGVSIAYRYLEVYGHEGTAWLATSIYDKLTPHNQGIFNIQDRLYWSCSPKWHKLDDEELKWPIEPMKFNKWNRARWGGLANVMLSISAAEFMDGNTCSKLATFAIHDFLEQGMKRKKSA